MFVAVIIQADSGVRLCSLLGTMVKKRRHGQSCGGEDRTETDMEAGLLEQYQCWNTGVSVLEHSQRNVIISTQLLEGFDINEFRDRHRPSSLESGWLLKTWQTVVYYPLY